MDADLEKLLKLLPVRIKPLEISQQFEATKMNRLLSAPAIQSQERFRGSGRPLEALEQVFEFDYPSHSILRSQKAV